MTRLINFKWSYGYFDKSEAYINTHNRFWGWLCCLYLRLRGFKEVKEEQ